MTNQDYQRELEDRSMDTVRSQLLGERKTTSSRPSYILGGSFIKLEQVLGDIQLNSNSIIFQDWKDSHAAYRILEAKKTKNSRQLFKSISRAHFPNKS